MRHASLLISLVLFGCRSEGDPKDAQNDISSVDSGSGLTGLDQDGDGFDDTVDCDDANTAVYPGAPERCDSLDNDCNGTVDDDVVSTWYFDADADGYGNPNNSFAHCNPPWTFLVADSTDCNDSNVDIYPGAEEVCDDADNDCDASIDEGVTETYWADVDDDGWGDAGSTIQSCSEPSGYTDRAGDCDDGLASVNPNAWEICDGIDNDCDASIDEYGAFGGSIYYQDADGDGYGDPLAGTSSCSAPSGFVDNSGDCDDTSLDVNPDAVEVCDGIDNDCDATVDGVDDDGDGFLAEACGGGDCDDTNADINPGETEVWYDGTDADCSGGSDYDADEDGYDSDAHSGTDCDDADGGIHPGAADTPYDGIDTDCSGTSDYDLDGDGYDAVAHGGDDCNDTDATVNPGVAETWYDGIDSDCSGGSDYDADGDSYLAEAYGGTDCDDTDGSVSPGASETWYDGIDSNCDGASDYDADEDGYDSDAHSGTDCDDALDSVNPGAVEICDDGIDQDCDDSPATCGPWDDLDVDLADAILRGGSADDRAGQGDPGFGAAGDFNGDGYGDVVVGALRESSVASRAGAAYVVFGPLSGQKSLSSADLEVTGLVSNDYVGRGVAGTGDVNNDGYDDILIGAIGVDTAGADAGAAYLVLGPASGSMSVSSADATLLGEAAGDIAGELGPVGDVDGDGYDDVFVGAQYNDSQRGAAYLLFGPVSGSSSLSAADAIIVGESAGDEAASSIGGGGDIDGDGLPDLLIASRMESSAYSQAGAAYVVLGPASGTLNLGSADAKLTGEHAGAQIGWGVSLSSAGDVNNDGYDDIVVGARYDSDAASYAGAAYIVNGPISGTHSLSTATAKLLGEAASDYTGDSTHGAGDVDGDGYDDVIVGSGYSDLGATNAGVVYVVRGPISGTSSLGAADSRLIADGSEDRARGRGAGDVDGDGLMDVMAGAQLNDDAGVDAGATYLFYGSGL